MTDNVSQYRLADVSEQLSKLKLGRERASQAAHFARRTLGIPEDEPIRDLYGFVEQAGIKLLLIQLAFDDFFGLSVAKSSGGPAIVVNVWERISVERRIFTTAHELGHLLLHFDGYDVNEAEENEAAELLRLSITEMRHMAATWKA